MKVLALLLTAAVVSQLLFCRPVQANATQVKELNLVFLHGAGGNAGSLQRLRDHIEALLPDYALNYEQANPGTTISYNALSRSYPNDVDIASWADNITVSLDKHFKNKRNLILVGHSMGGKSALYSVAHDVNGVADKVAMVVTINSPIRRLDKYTPAGSISLNDYYRAVSLIEDRGVADSVLHYDSAEDGKLVGTQKHWLAFISAESAPSSPEFDYGAVDLAPRDMDDQLIPISGQYASGADVVYYGEKIHGSVGSSDEVAGFMAETILRYVFGGDISCSIFNRGGSFEHKSDLWPGSDEWVDVVDETPANSGRVRHSNTSFFQWQEWEDIVGVISPGTQRGDFQTKVAKGVPLLRNFLGKITEVRWFDPDNPADHQLVIKTRAAPRSSVTVDWNVSQRNLLPSGVERTYYEVRIVTGMPFTGISRASWVSADPSDTRVRIRSRGESPFRWFVAEWRVYTKQTRSYHIIDEIGPSFGTIP